MTDSPGQAADPDRPGGHDEPGRRPPATTISLGLLALGAGATDALSWAGLGGSFTSVMTGNLVLVGLALGEPAPMEAVRPAVAICAFIVGVYFAAIWLRRARAEDATPWPDRVSVTLGMVAFVQVGVLLCWLAGLGDGGAGQQSVLIALSATAMGAQSAAVSALALAGAATTYLTGTLASLTTELATTGRPATMRRRFIVLLALLLGAVLEAALLTGVRPMAPALPLVATLAALGVMAVRRPAGS